MRNGLVQCFSLMPETVICISQNEEYNNPEFYTLDCSAMEFAVSFTSVQSFIPRILFANESSSL